MYLILTSLAEDWIWRPPDFPQASFFWGFISQEGEKVEWLKPGFNWKTLNKWQAVRKGTTETSSSAPATLHSTVGTSKAVVSLFLLSCMNFNFTVLLLSIHKGPLLNSQLAICSQPSAGKQGSTVMVGGEGHGQKKQWKDSNINFCFAKCTKCRHAES